MSNEPLKPLDERDLAFKLQCEIISDYSEYIYCAGWLDGIELSIWEWLMEWRSGKSVDVQSKPSRISIEKLVILDSINTKWGIWPLFKDGYDEPQPHSSEDVEQEIKRRKDVLIALGLITEGLQKPSDSGFTPFQ